MQYTGLKDKKKVKIFEGDILGYPNKNIKNVVRFGKYKFEGDEYASSGIGFYLEEHSFGIKKDQESGIYWHPTSDNEVIGNIYEDKQLLE